MGLRYDGECSYAGGLKYFRLRRSGLKGDKQPAVFVIVDDGVGGFWQDGELSTVKGLKYFRLERSVWDGESCSDDLVANDAAGGFGLLNISVCFSESLEGVCTWSVSITFSICNFERYQASI